MINIVIFVIIIIVVFIIYSKLYQNRENFWSWNYWYNWYNTTPCIEDVFGTTRCYPFGTNVYPFYWPYRLPYRRYKRIFRYA